MFIQEGGFTSQASITGDTLLLGTDAGLYAFECSGMANKLLLNVDMKNLCRLTVVAVFKKFIHINQDPMAK